MGKTKYGADALLQELWAIALARATDILQVKDGVLEVRDTGSLTKTQSAAIASLEKGPGGIKVKFYDKLKALELLGKHLGLFDSHPEDGQRQDNLLAAILEATKEEVPYALSGVQPQADAGNDMVEQTPS